MDPSIPLPRQDQADRAPLVWILACDADDASRVDASLRRQESLARFRIFAERAATVASLATHPHPDVLLVDICNGCSERLAMISHFRVVAPATRVMVIAKGDDEETIVRAVCAGATGYLIRGIDPPRLVEAIREILGGGTPMDPRVAHKVLTLVGHLAHQAPAYALTERERDVLRLVADGRAKKEIAEVLCISFFTVDTHLKNIYEKMHVHSQGAAVSRAFKDHLLH